MLALLLLWAGPACGQITAPAPRGIAEIHRRFHETTDNAERAALVPRLAQTAPTSGQDVHALFDLFSTYGDRAVRNAVMSSLHRLTAPNAALEPLFVSLLSEGEAESVYFGIHGALAIRAESALPLIEKIAKRKFKFKNPSDAALMSEKNAWWSQYEALSALAQWRGAEAYPLLKRKADQAPAVAGIMAAYLWRQTLPDIAAWSASSREADHEKARKALAADVEPIQLRQARPDMIKILHDPKAGKELRHRIALKIGFSSTEEEVAALIKDYDQTSVPDDRLLLSAAIFASGSRQAVPLLKHVVKENPAPQARLGALYQLKELLPSPEFLSLLAWFSRHDPDLENKLEAERELKLLNQ